MKRSYLWIVAVVLAAAVVAVGIWMLAKPAPSWTGSAPDAVVYDANGNAVKLSDFAGKPVVLNFWASWCGPCKMLAPVVAQLAEEYAGKAKIAKANVDEQMELATQFQVYSIPTLVVIKGGKATAMAVGVQTPEQLDALMAKN